MNIKNIFILLVGMFLGAVFLIGFSLYINSRTVVTNGYDITINPEVTDKLNIEYNQSMEKAFCLNGKIDREFRTVQIDSISNVTGMINYTKTKIDFNGVPCPNSLGMIHTHPKYLIFDQCRFSNDDFFATGYYVGSSSNVLGAVMCGENKFSFYVL